ncbi:hypothetical protein ABZ831_35020, partial [Streptomyces sp. NPDC047123]
MQLRRRKGAAAIAVAVMAGALGGAPGALAAPGTPGRPGAATASPDSPAVPGASPDSPSPAVPAEALSGTTASRTGEAGPPAVWPRPQSIEAAGGAVPVGDDVVLVAPDPGTEDADPYALTALRTLLHDAGARHVTTVRDGDPLPAGGGLLVRAGGAGADRALRSLG